MERQPSVGDATNLVLHQYSHSIINADQSGKHPAAHADANVMLTNVDGGGRMEMVEMTKLDAPQHVVHDQPGSADSNESIDRSVGVGLGWRVEDCEEIDLLIPPRPNKSHVLHYFANAHTFNIRRVDRDIQITDGDGFPLFDAYADADCTGPVWTIESYGKTVLCMREFGGGDWCRNPSKLCLTVRDWNGDFLGELFPGDPFYVKNSDRKVIVKMTRHGRSNSANGAKSTVSEESTALTARSGPSSESMTTLGQSTCCWICVQEDDEKQIARVDDSNSIQFNKDVPFHIKLLSLAGIVRLVGQNASPSTSTCIGIAKSILNCCAGY